MRTLLRFGRICRTAKWIGCFRSLRPISMINRRQRPGRDTSNCSCLTSARRRRGYITEQETLAMPLHPTIAGRSFLGHTATRRPLPDVALGLSGDKDVAAPVIVRRIADLARRVGRPRSRNEKGHWSGFRIADVNVVTGGESAARPRIEVTASGRSVLRGRSRIGGDGVRRVEVHSWNRGKWQRKLFRRSVILPSADA